MEGVLSEAELKFLLEGGTGNPKHDAVMRHRIRRKLQKFQRDELPALKRNEWTERWLHDVVVRVIKDCNQVTENCNALQDSVMMSENQKSVLNASFVKLRRPGRDLNPRRRLDRPACLVSEVITSN